MIGRRNFLVTGAAFAAGCAAPRKVWAQNALTLGETRIDTLSDGGLRIPAEFTFGPMDQEALRAALEPFGMTPDGVLTPPCNVTLLRDGERTVLFDAGSGSGFQSSAGELASALEAIDVAPEDVTHVVFTHGHPDHLWGVLDDFDDPLFPEATHLMGRAEFEYWTDENTAASIGESRQAFVIGAQRRLEAVADQIELFEDGQEILPGVAARLTPGHTPGHMSFEARSGSQAVMILGDAIGNHHVAFAKPDWLSGSDQDPALAAKTRLALLDQLSAEATAIIGFHLPGGGAGRVERAGGAYRFAPLAG